MEPIEFEHVTIESLQASQRDERKAQQGQAAANTNPNRAPALPTDQQLSEEAERWLKELPESVRPNKLASSYPRVVNRLCQCWRRPLEADRYFEDLLTDKRGGRQGFPLGVALELASLSDHYRTVVYPVRKTVWDYQLTG